MSGDWQSRVDLFNKLIWHNSRVRRLGEAYRDVNDFLHDVMTNVLRTGHSYDPEEGLGEWVESVAAWTALERQRMRDIDAAVEVGRIRMCAGTEGDEPNYRARLAAYAPPHLSPSDSPISRIASLVGDAQFALLSMRAIDDHGWEEIARAAGKPQNTIGPTMVRTVDRLARFFGAPPPLNADLEPVFTWAIREDAKTTHGDPEKQKGRIISLHTDPAFYSLTPELRSIGISVPSEVRTIRLWDAARASTPPEEPLREHLGKCNYCADQLRALLLMQQALQNANKGDFSLCPGGFTLLNTPEQSFDAFERHLAECLSCQEERARLLGDISETSKVPGDSRAHVKLFAWAAAAILVLAGGYFSERYFSAPKQPRAEIAEPVADVEVNKRYSDLAQPINVNDKNWLTSVLPQDLDTFNALRDAMQSGHMAAAMVKAADFRERDPAIQMLYSVGLYGQGAFSEGYYGMLKAEAMSPRQSFRCWTMMQCALIVGEMKVVEREAEHLSSDPGYAKKAQDLLARAKAR